MDSGGSCEDRHAPLMDSLCGTEQVEQASRLLEPGRQSAASDFSSHIVAAQAIELTQPRSSSIREPLAASGGGDTASENGSEPASDLFAQVDSLIKPVSATMLLVVGLVGVLNSSPVSGSFSNMMVYEEKEEDSTSTKLAGSVENAAIFIALIVGVTTLLFLLYKFHCTKLIYAWLITSVGMLLASFGGLVAYMLIVHLDIAMDSVSGTFLLWNFAAVGVRVVFWPSPPILKQTYLVIVSVLLAWSLTKLPDWTTWSILAAVSVWDLIAVLTPHGPLKGLVEESQRRNEPIPGLVYEADDVKLGLGDFVFYSVLIGRAMLHDVTTVVTCFVAILMGLGTTLLLLAIYQKALPALPISIGLGMVFYFLTAYLVTPMVEMLNEQVVFI
ncbi:Presenilin-domain-containing protein [Pavlovales sp. CCMP2436]|nr:Presenilin-domain-containing protein [Pavlovales sp. CCMP2436]|mmetsp:Transcript_21487/g.54515  ORF Transcript_21487/g.54515 Transcript_21487/m.54515 type:complete len:386 (-) Transcript_21487:88-1245(-)